MDRKFSGRDRPARSAVDRLFWSAWEKQILGGSGADAGPVIAGAADEDEGRFLRTGELKHPRTLDRLAASGKLAGVLALAFLLSSTILVPPTFAQTVRGQPPFANGRTVSTGNTTPSVPTSPPKPQVSQAQTSTSVGQAQASQASQVPPPESVLRQAQDQSEGYFSPLSRQARQGGGQIQEAWDDNKEAKAVFTYERCEDCVYKVRTREFMISTLILPEDATIAAADVGDPAGFGVRVVAANKIAVKPAAYGLDTNLNVYTKAGKVYAFYLRSENVASSYTPDLIVRIRGRESPETQVAVPAFPDQAGGASPITGNVRPGDPRSAAVNGLTNPKSASGDFVRTVAFDPSKLHGWRDYKLWGDEALKPVTVFRDDFFTYIQYGTKFDPLDLPTAYVVKDGVDELVNTRVQGSTFIVEATAPLITLKNGKTFLCVQYTGAS